MTRIRPFTDTREHLLATGESIMLGKGFAAVGLAEILNSAGVPKGSFYHYFRSKEGFGVDMLERYFSQYEERLDELLNQNYGTARSRLLDYFASWIARQCDAQSQSCLAVKLSGEVSDLSEPMREALAKGMSRVIARLADCIRSGQQDGSIPAQADADQSAGALYALWIGSALLSKVQHSAAPMQLALRQTEQLFPLSN